jgi:hypothetical protein
VVAVQQKEKMQFDRGDVVWTHWYTVRNSRYGIVLGKLDAPSSPCTYYEVLIGVHRVGCYITEEHYDGVVMRVAPELQNG